MRRFYRLVADQLRNFLWGRSLVNHITRHYRLYDNIEAVFSVLVVVLIIKAFLVDVYQIPSSSMHDTLIENDRIVVNKLQYRFGDVQIGDVIVFRTRGIPIIDDPDKPYYIKRVVGLPGDDLEIRGGGLFRNGQKIESPAIFLENYYIPLPSNNQRAFRVPDGHVLVFGDNSSDSWDSRGWGPVPLENIVGKAFFRYWPPSRIGALHGVAPASSNDLRRRFESDEAPLFR